MTLSQKSGNFVKVGIVGGTGYVGIELLQILIRHPNVVLTSVTSRREFGLPISDLYPHLKNHLNLNFSSSEENNLIDCDIVFFSTPHGVAMKETPKLIEKGTKIIDLAADFRIKDTEIFEKWYKIPHLCPDILQQSEYGLVELNRLAISKAQVVGNPGCYPTTILLGLAPLLKNQESLIDLQTLITDCKSGVSGAGRSLDHFLLFSEISDNFKAYSVKGHRHYPEIIFQLEKLSRKKVDLTFVPHLVPMIRGMFSTIYARVLPHAKQIDFQNLFEQYYQNEKFIDIMPEDSLPETRSVRSSNNLRISVCYKRQTGILIILVIQDNLVKGAAGQAIQNMNVMFNFPEETGLNQVSFLP